MDKHEDIELIYASARGSFKIIKSLLENDTDVNIYDEYGSTALHCASMYGYLEIVNILLEYNADINIRDEYGDTPLHHASKHGHLKVAEILLEYDANINVENDYGYTPLCYAVIYGYIDLVKFLLEKRAIIDKYCIENAVLFNKYDIAKILLSYGLKTWNPYKELAADYNISDKFGNSAIHLAIQNGNHEILKLLLENYSNSQILSKDCRGNSLIHSAAYGIVTGHGNCLAIIKWLLINYEINPFHTNSLGQSPRDIIDKSDWSALTDEYDEILDDLGLYEY
jgi:ankyrin repeat protein